MSVPSGVTEFESAYQAGVASTRDEIASLRARLAQAERERDDARDVLGRLARFARSLVASTFAPLGLNTRVIDEAESVVASTSPRAEARERVVKAGET